VSKQRGLRTIGRGSGATVSVGTPMANERAYGNPIPYAAPGVIALVLWVLALLERLALRRDDYNWYWSAFVALVYGGLAWFAWWASRPRGPKVCLLFTGSTAFAGAWTWYLIGVPHQTWRPHVVYWGAALLSWGCTAVYLATKGDGEAASRLDDLKGAVSRLRAVNEIETTASGEIVARYEMQEGTPASDLQKDSAVLASLLPGTRPDGVKVRPSKDNAVVGELRVSPIDRLAKPVPWRGPSGGRTAADPVRLGLREAGGFAEFWLTADRAAGRNAPIVAVVGMSGSGKTELLLILLQDLLPRPDVEYWFADPRKAGQMPAWVRRSAARWAEGKAETAKMVKAFADEVDPRSKALGAHGCRVWTAGCCYERYGIKLRVLLVDEAAGVAVDIAETLVNMAESVRSVGQVPVLAFQRGTGDRFPTSARSQFNAHICLGVQEENDAVHGGLPDDVLDAGAQPWLWGAHAPGMHILAAPGIPDELRASSCRTFDTREAAALMAEYADRFLDQHLGVVAEPVEDDLEYDEAAATVAEMMATDLEADSDTEMADLAGEANGGLDAEDATDLRGVGVNDDIPVPDPPPGDEVVALEPRMTPAAARRTVYGYLCRLREAGARQFRVADHIDALHTATGMKQKWMYGVAGEFCEPSDCGPAVLRQIEDRGPYELIGPVHRIGDS
jgi:hypothetical protein